MPIKCCCVCEKKDAAYKCPKCKKPYCSIECCKEHKTQPCESPILLEESKENKNVSTQKYEFPTEDTVPIEKLQQLRHSKELKECLQYPQLRDIMRGILNSSNPTEAIALAMKEPIFTEMADACLKIVEPPDEAKPY
ncbi:zinc finger HIT domain-containing protein 3 [Pogonomyrmex barbatus]|uniref:Zinc finger HIT domain-containing protein 3 n=1 Tax=Pogonomyrmex barbatus TaxID=144034 RepID=A0A6I9X582_9HYME|nr:zinc finger HIT domain-containing protein 3 [Pogonomyrmex barbatus]